MRDAILGWLAVLTPVAVGGISVPLGRVILRFRGWLEGLPDLAKRLVVASISYWTTFLAVELGVTFSGQVDQDAAAVLGALFAFVFYGHKRGAS